MKRVLLINFEYPIGRAYCGGVGQIVKQSRQALLDLNYEVYVLISSEFRKKYPVRLLLSDGSILRYSSFSNFQKKYDLDYFDYIIQHFVNWAKELRKLKKCRGKRPKIIYHFHSILRRERDSGFKTLNHFLSNQEKMIEIADKVICPSRYEYNNFIRYFPHFSDKIYLIENTVETFPRREDKINNIKARYGIKENDIVSIYVGRIEKIKGAEIVIRETPKMLKKYKRLKIFIIGKALERRLYKKLMKIQKKFPKQIFYLRYVGKNTLFQLYYISHIYINSSLSESFSLTTHESALCNNALLLNSLPVFDKFRDAALFFSSCEDNKDEFIFKYERLIKSKHLRNKFSRKADRIANDFLAKKNLTGDFRRFFESLKI